MKTATIALCLALAGTANAEFFDGNKLLARLKGDTREYMQALGYITGVADALMGTGHCPPPNVTAGQISDMVQLHLENSPSTRDKTADVHVLFVLQRQWPCAKRSGSNGI